MSSKAAVEMFGSWSLSVSWRQFCERSGHVWLDLSLTAPFPSLQLLNDVTSSYHSWAETEGSLRGQIRRRQKGVKCVVSISRFWGLRAELKELPWVRQGQRSTGLPLDAFLIGSLTGKQNWPHSQRMQWTLIAERVLNQLQSCGTFSELQFSIFIPSAVSVQAVAEGAVVAGFICAEILKLHRNATSLHALASVFPLYSLKRILKTWCSFPRPVCSTWVIRLSLHN